MTWRTLETASWLTLYAGVISFLLLWNSASPTYNAIYRDRSVADWLPGVSRDYEPGATISGTEPSPYFDSGWWRSDKEFRWGRGTRNGLIIVPTHEIPAGSRIVTHFGIFPLRLPPQPWVDVIVNGERLMRGIAGAEKRRFEIPLPFALPAGEPATIILASQLSKSPLSQGYGLDQRELSVFFFDLAVLPPE